MQHFDIPADLDTPVSAFLKIAPFGPRFLLESVEGGEYLGRYSFIGFGSGRDITLTATDIDPLTKLRTGLQEAPTLQPQIPDLPYRGGLVGFASFELAGSLYDKGTSASEEVVLGSYFAPTSLLVFDHLTHRIALLHSGTEVERQCLRREIIGALRGGVPDNGNGRSFEGPAPTFSRDRFMDAVERARTHIREGDVYQLVLSVGFVGECEMDPFQVYRALRILNPSPYMYFLKTQSGTIAGSSPEALVRLTGRTAALRPIAGTRPRGADPKIDKQLEEELLADAKEAAEHVMLVDLARNDLGRVAVPGSLELDPYRAIERYSHVMHIVSGVQGVLRPESDALDLFASTFPAGTVVGAPKLRAMELIGELEPSPRGFYAGTVGYFGSEGGMDQAIAIRTIGFDNNQYRYQAGAGIVFDSSPEREYEEVLAKSAVLKAGLETAREGL